MIAFYGVKGASIFRKLVHICSKDFPEAVIFGDKINRIEETKTARVVIEEFFSRVAKIN